MGVAFVGMQAPLSLLLETTLVAVFIKSIICRSALNAAGHHRAKRKSHSEGTSYCVENSIHFQHE